MGLQEIIKEHYVEEGKKEVVFGMLAEGLSVDAIVRITKLPFETIIAWKTAWEKTK